MSYMLTFPFGLFAEEMEMLSLPSPGALPSPSSSLEPLPAALSTVAFLSPRLSFLSMPGSSLPSESYVPALPSVRDFGAPALPANRTKTENIMPSLGDWATVSPKNSLSLNTSPEEKKNRKKNLPGQKKIRILFGGGSMEPVEPRWQGILMWPVEGKVSSGFGPRGSHLHAGIDIPLASGTPIHAVMEGIVVASRVYNGYGNTVILDHGDDLQTLYAHCSKLLVKEGDVVTRGEVIAFVGNTGRSSTSHLHFGVLLAGVFRDPMAVLKRRTEDRFVEDSKNKPKTPKS
ncbi:MAG: M23 family metallopeptidase [Synergistaceae bacterium]|nr:M23 family metallopeptidase [Synergistaceae bacterium]